jgi:hypothetical protein
MPEKIGIVAFHGIAVKMNPQKFPGLFIAALMGIRIPAV